MICYPICNYRIIFNKKSIFIMNKIYFTLISLCILNFQTTMHASHVFSKEEKFNILGLPANASQEDIKKAYRKLSLQWHPDRNKSPEALSQFQKISGAYNDLYKGPESEQCAKLKTGLSFEQRFEINVIVSKINQLLKMHPSINISEQNLPSDLDASNYKEELQSKKELLSRIQETIEQKKASLNPEDTHVSESAKEVIHENTIRVAQIVFIFEEIKKKYAEKSLDVELPDPLTTIMSIEQARNMYNHKIELLEHLYEIKKLVEENEAYISLNTPLSYLLKTDSITMAEDYVFQIKALVNKRKNEQYEIESLLNKVKELFAEEKLSGKLPDPKTINLEFAKEYYEHSVSFVQCLHDIKNALNKNSFSWLFLASLPQQFDSENVHESFNKINKEIERLKIEHALKVQEKKRLDELHTAQNNINLEIKFDRDYVSDQFVSDTFSKFTSIEQVQDVRSQLFEEVKKNKLQKLQVLYARTIQYQSFATLGLAPLFVKKSQDKCNKNILDLKHKLEEQAAVHAETGKKSQFNVILEQAKNSEFKAKKAMQATVFMGLGLATAATGLAAHYYYKNK